jgi:transcriptional regulator with XRE-family HTH domain
MDTFGIGRRIAYWRERRRMTQSDFGALLGKSRRWVQDLEGGQRQSDPRLSVLEGAARILSIRLEDLLSGAPARAGLECVDESELAAIRDTLDRHDIITGSCDDATGELVLIESLQRSVEYSWTAFQAGSFASLGRIVPDLIIDATRAATQSEGDSRVAAFRLLSMSLQLVEALATKFGDTPLAFTAADRAVIAAEHSEDPIIMAAAARHLSDAMTQSGRPQQAADFAIAAAARLEADLTQRGTEGLSVLGMLYLKAAMAAAAAEDLRTASTHLAQASGEAARLGEDANALWTAFGPTNVAVHRVAAYVHLSEGGDAVAAADTLSQADRDALPRERRAHHLVDLAHAYTQAGQRSQAVDTLLSAENVAAEEVRCRSRSLELVEDLRLLGVGAAEGRLQALAQRCGLLP